MLWMQSHWFYNLKMKQHAYSVALFKSFTASALDFFVLFLSIETAFFSSKLYFLETSTTISKTRQLYPILLQTETKPPQKRKTTKAYTNTRISYLFLTEKALRLPKWYLRRAHFIGTEEGTLLCIERSPNYDSISATYRWANCEVTVIKRWYLSEWRARNAKKVVHFYSATLQESRIISSLNGPSSVFLTLVKRRMSFILLACFSIAFTASSHIILTINL